MTAAEVAEALGGAHGAGAQFMARCPSHDDGSASLSLTDDPGGKLLVKCHAGCPQAAVIEQLKARGLWRQAPKRNGNGHGEPPRTIVATYPYHGADGLVYEVVRFAPKDFRQRRPDPDKPGSYLWNLKGITRIPYRLPELTKAVATGRRIFIVEGEKDADALAAVGFMATCNAGGAGKWTADLARWLDGAAEVVVIADKDGPGRAHAQQVAAITAPLVRSLKVLELPGETVKDAHDWLAAGGNRTQMIELVDAAPVWAPPSSEQAKQEPPAADPPADPTADLPADFIRNEDGKIVKSAIPNIGLALARLGVELWHDEFADRTMARTGSAPPRPIEDHDLDRWWIQTDQQFRFRPPQTLWRTVVMDLARRQTRHPVRAYLDSLRWDGTPRVDRWLVDLAGAADEPYVLAVSAIVLIAAVRRVRQPGCKFDELLVLESAQGAFKSTALAALCPTETWFTDHLPLNADGRDAIEATAGHWIVEVAELSGIRRGEVEAVKAFLSRRVDRARLAYARLPIERPRQWIAIGTSNPSGAYLRDASGNRRFWPVAVIQFNAEAVAATRDQLWAEAAHREAAGESIRLPYDLWDEAGRHQEARRLVDPFDDVLADALGGDGVGPDGLLATDEAWRILGIEAGRQTLVDAARLASGLERLGFKSSRRRRDGERTRCWVRGNSEAWIVIPTGGVAPRDTRFPDD